MMLKKSIILSFEEEDLELWELLDRLPADRQAAIVKEVLLKHLKEFPAESHPSLPQQGTGLDQKADQDPDVPQEAHEGLHEAAGKSRVVSGGWSLESLFEPKNDHRSEEEAPTAVEIMPNPLKHLLEMIGEEDDEEVLGFFTGKDER